MEFKAENTGWGKYKAITKLNKGRMFNQVADRLYPWFNQTGVTAKLKLNVHDCKEAQLSEIHAVAYAVNMTASIVNTTRRGDVIRVFEVTLNDK